MELCELCALFQIILMNINSCAILRILYHNEMPLNII